MRAKRLTSLIVLAAAVGLAYSARRRRGEPARRAVPAGADLGTTPDEVDPTAFGRVDDEVEQFVEAVAASDFELSPDLDVEVADPALDPTLSGAPAGSRVEPHPYPEAALESDLPPGEAARPDVYGDRAARGDGDLYGVHVVAAGDTELPDDDLAFDEGENWLEHLEATSAEIGPEPGRPLDMRDESERGRGRHKSATSDIPVADRGSGGPRGL